MVFAFRHGVDVRPIPFNVSQPTNHNQHMATHETPVTTAVHTRPQFVLTPTQPIHCHRGHACNVSWCISSLLLRHGGSSGRGGGNRIGWGGIRGMRLRGVMHSSLCAEEHVPWCPSIVVYTMAVTCCHVMSCLHFACW